MLGLSLRGSWAFISDDGGGIAVRAAHDSGPSCQRRPGAHSYLMHWWERDGAEIGRVIRVLVKYTIYLAVAIVCMRFTEWLMETIFGQDRAFGLFPIGWPFLAGDLGMAFMFYYYAARELRHIFGGSVTHDPHDI
jgi:hypothetical protein